MNIFIKKALLVLLVIIFTFISCSVFAADFIGPDDSGNVNIEKSEKLKNVFAAGNILKIQASIFKNLFAAGSSIEINGDVEHDLWVAGSTIYINGNVGGNIYVAGSSIEIAGKVDGDIFCISGNFLFKDTASSNGNLYINSGIIDLRGIINDDIYLNAGQVNIQSKIKGNVNINSTGIIKIGSETIIDGNLTYNSIEEANIEDGVKIVGETKFSKTEFAKKDIGKRRILNISFWMKMLIGIATGMMLVYLFGRITNPIVKESLTNFWSSLGIGFAGLFVGPIAIIFLFITMLGSYIGLISGTLYVLFLILSTALAGVTLGSLLLKTYKRDNEYTNNWLSVLIGIIIISFAKLIPIIGWLPGFVFTIIGFGAFLKLSYKFLSSKQTNNLE